MTHAAHAFGVQKFKSLLVAGTFTVLAGYVVRLTDAVVAGRLLGESALAGVNLVAPCLSIITFLAGLIATGCGTCYSIAMGRCDRLRARQYFMQALWSTLIFGGVLAALFIFGHEAFFAYMGAAPDVTAHARDYLVWLWPVAVLEGLECLLVSLGYADGDAELCMGAYGALFVVNLLVSLLAVHLGMGTAGCALGSVIAALAAIGILSVHFFKKTNSFAPVRHFAWRDTWQIACASFGDAAAFLCDGLLFFFVNKFVIVHFGSNALPVVGVVTALWGFLELFNGVGTAIQPIVTVYYGEQNTTAMRTVMHAAMRVSFIEGLLFAVFFAIWPASVVQMIGITDPTLVQQSCTAVRYMCFGFVPLAFAGLFNSYYMFIERSGFAGVLTFLCYLIAPVACVAICSLRGLGGVWFGMGLGPLVGLLIVAAALVSTEGRAMFPLLIPRVRDAKLHVFNFTLSEYDIVTTSREIAGRLQLAGVSASIAARASLITEEVLMAIRDRNGSRHVIGEATLDLNDGVRLTLRDDGEIFDITDADQQISSLRSFLVASMMQFHDGRQNLVTTGFNRNVFSF